MLKKATQFESAVFFNNGDGTYKKQILPIEIQLSPVRDIQTGDFNEDGIPDLLVAGNNYSTRPSLGRQDASYGWLMPGNETFAYKILWPNESGLSMAGDMRKMHLIELEDESVLVSLTNNGYLETFKY